MARPKQQRIDPPTSVSMHFVLDAQAGRAPAFRAGMTAMLHAGFSFGRDLPGYLVYSRDLSGDNYSTTERVPTGSITTVQQAQARLHAIAAFYNQSVGFAFSVAREHVPVSSRVYDEPGALVFSLDWSPASWQQIQARQRTPQLAAHTLIDAGRIIFTLLPLTYLLIGPTSLLDELPVAPSHTRLQAVPIAMVARHPRRPTPRYGNPVHVEALSRGTLIVQRWDIGAAIASPPSRRAAFLAPRSHRR